MTTQIQLKKMRFYAFHGVSPQEAKVGNYFIVNMTLTAPLDNAVRTDDLNCTTNYATVFSLVKEEMDIPSKLLEHVAGRILKVMKYNFPQLTQIEISVSKLNPPIRGELESASVILKEIVE